MKKKTLALLSAAVMVTAVMAGCSSNKATETTAPATSAPADEASTEAPTEAPEAKNLEADLVVAGGDGAGLVAAIQAVKEGMDPTKIVIVETTGELAADIASMGDSMNASNTDEQYAQEIEDSFEAYLGDIKKAGNGKNNEVMAEFLAENSEEALLWLRDVGIELEGVTKGEGATVARSYAATGDKKLSEALTEALIKEVETLKIQVLNDSAVDEILFAEDGSVSGVKLTGKDGQETINCTSLILADKELLPLLEKETLTFTKDADEKSTGVLINTCAEVVKEGEISVPGLYAVGGITDAALFGEKALAGDQITGSVLLGSTAGTEAAVYVSDNK